MTNVLLRSPGGGGGGGINIYDEDLLIASDVTCLNFKGTDIQAVAGSGSCVNVFSPPAVVAPFLDAVGINFPAGVNAIISDPQGTFNTSPYSIGDTAESHLAPTNLTGSTPSRIRDFNNGASVTIRFNGVDMDTLTISNEGNPETSPGGYISVSNFNYNSLGQWEAILSITIPFTVWLAAGGGADIQILHNTTIDGLHQWGTNRFYDIGSSPPTADDPIVTVNTPVLKYLSGVPYYTVNSTFNISVMNGQNFWNQTYITYPLRIDYSEFAAGTVDYDKNNLNPGHLPDPYWNDPAFYSGNTFTISSSPSVCTTNARVRSRVADAFNTASWQYQNTPPYYLVNNWGTVSTDLSEQFKDEYYRLTAGNYDSVPATYTGVWDSTQNISTYDDGNGLQVACNGLIFPTTDYSNNYLPVGPDYSSLGGNRTYYRAFIDSPNTHANCVLRLTGLSFSDIEEGGANQHVRVEIKLPTQTGWGNVGKWYVPSEDPTVDGWGALDSYTGSDFSVTFHGKYTADSGYMFILRITYLDNTPTLTYAAVVDW